jgi:hypothetical protein
LRVTVAGWLLREFARDYDQLRRLARGASPPPDRYNAPQASPPLGIFREAGAALSEGCARPSRSS